MRFGALAFAGAAVLAACADPADLPFDPTVNFAAASGMVSVTSPADAGPGSFRAAVEAANADPTIGTIHFAENVGTIVLAAPVTYTGAQALSVWARGAALDGSGLGADEAALVANGGGNLSFRGLTVHDAPGNGITVAVPADASGTFVVALDGVTIRGNGGHGVLINDQTEYFDNPDSEASDGSDAAVVVRVTGSRFVDNGFSALDRDGLRINEGGLGVLDVVISRSSFAGNGADGLELDERGDGDVVFTVQQTDFTANGYFSSDDYDDGIDVDELGDGDVIGTFIDVTANDNAEQGIDLNENDAGDMRITMRNVDGSRNNEEGIEFEEDDDFAGGGDIIADLRNVTANGNGALDGDAGLKLREKGAGNMRAELVNVEASDNAVRGIQVREDAAGDLTASIVNAKTLRNGDDGVMLDENGDGNLDGSLTAVASSDNEGAGADVEQATAGTGQVVFQTFTATGNADGAIDPSGVVVVEKP